MRHRYYHTHYGVAYPCSFIRGLRNCRLCVILTTHSKVIFRRNSPPIMAQNDDNDEVCIFFSDAINTF
jgi:hypothetical protein